MSFSSRLYIVLALIVIAPLLMGARRPPEWPLPRIITPTQQRVIDYVTANGLQFIEFTEITSAFSCSYGCRMDETAFLFSYPRRDGSLWEAGVCVQNGTGDMRRAPLRRVEGNYPASNVDDDESEEEEE